MCRQDDTCTQQRQQFVQVVNIVPSGLADYTAPGCVRGEVTGDSTLSMLYVSDSLEAS